MEYPKTQQALKPLKLIIAAMIFGPTMFAALTVFLVLGKIMDTQPDLANTLLATLGLLVLMEIPAYVVVRKISLAKLQKQLRGQAPDDEVGVELARGYTTITLIGAAMAEGVSLFGIVILLVTGAWLTLLAPVLGLFAIAAQFPTLDKFKRFAANITGQHWG